MLITDMNLSVEVLAPVRMQVLPTSGCRSFRARSAARAHTSGEDLEECLLWSLQAQRGEISGISHVKMGLRHILFNAAGSPYEEGLKEGL